MINYWTPLFPVGLQTVWEGAFFFLLIFKLSSFLIHFLNKDFPDALGYEKDWWGSGISDRQAPESIFNMNESVFPCKLVKAAIGCTGLLYRVVWYYV